MADILINDSMTQAQIQLALDTANDLDVVIFANGTYDLTATLTVRKDITIHGESREGVIINAAGAPTNSWAIALVADGATLENFTLVGGGTSGTNQPIGAARGIKAQPNEGTGATSVENLTIQNVTVENFHRAEIDLNGVHNSLVSDVTVDGNGTGGAGIAITDSTNIDLHNVETIDNAWGGVGIYTNGGAYPPGTDDIEFTGTFSSSGEIQPIYSEADNGGTYPPTNVVLPNGYDYAVYNDEFRTVIEGSDGAEFLTYFDSEVDAAAYAALLNTRNGGNTASVVYENAGGDGEAFVLGDIIVSEGMSLQAAIDGAAPNSTIYVHPGIYNENIVIDVEGLTIVATGDGVVLRGDFKEANSLGSTVFDGLKTATGYSGDAGVTIVANGVTLDGINVDNFMRAIVLGGQDQGNPADGPTLATDVDVSGTTLKNLDITSFVLGLHKGGYADVTDLVVENVDFGDGYIGVDFVKNTNALYAANGNASGVTFDDVDFTDILQKGIYIETLSDAHLTGIDMDNVGQYGGVPTHSATGLHGNGINLNLKNGTYSDIEIDTFNLVDTGLSNKDGALSSNATAGAIVIATRDDGGTYGAAPATATDIRIHDGTISGTTSTGIRAGEAGKNNAGPSLDIDNVLISGTQHSALHGDVGNEGQGTVTISGTNDGNTYIASTNSDGALVFVGDLGDDIYAGGSASDTVDYSATTQGVTVNDVEAYSTGMTDEIGYDTLSGIENVIGGSGNDEFFSTASGVNNTFVGGAGNDTFLAGSGDDTFVYESATAADGIATQFNSVRIVVNGGAEGTDDLRNVEHIRFENGDGTGNGPITIDVHAGNAVVYAQNDATTTNEDAVSATGNVLTNDINLDQGGADLKQVLKFGAGANATAQNAGMSVTGTYGSLVINSDGTYTYTPSNAILQSLAVGESVQDVFSYTASDNVAADTDTATLTITVTGNNDNPTFGYSQDFNTGSGSWGYGTIALQNSLVNRAGDTITAPDGSQFAVMKETGGSGPFDTLGGYRSDFVDGMTVETQVYLDTGWNTNEGFQYTVAASKADGQFLRDFAFEVVKDGSSGQLWVAATNNVYASPRTDLDAPVNSNIAAPVSSSGWYTLQHVFTQTGGPNSALAVVMNVIDSNGSIILSVTRSAPADLIASVGGNRYAWFADITVTDGVAVNGVKIVDIDTGSVTETAGVTDDAGVHSISGGVVFDDIDSSDTHTIQPATYDAPGYVGTFTPSIGHDATGSGVGGTLEWTFEVDDASLDQLAEGETLTQTYTVTILDNHGGTASKDIVVTIEGTNDIPVVSATTDAGAVTEDGSFDDGTPNDYADSVGGQVSATDVDNDAVLTWTAMDDSDAIASPYGTFTINEDGTWTFALDQNATATQSLNEDQSVTQTFTVKVTDEHGAQAAETVDVTITINGTNDAPVIVSGNTSGEVREDGDLDTPSIAANVAIDGKFEPGVDLDAYLATNGAASISTLEDMQVLLAGVQTQLGAGASEADAIAVVWDYIDDNFNNSNAAVIESSQWLGIEYARYLKEDGGDPLTEVVVKYTAGTREQSLHDNLLTNIREYALQQRWINPTSVTYGTHNPATYAEIVAALELLGLDGVRTALGINQPGYGGYVGEDAGPTIAADEANGLLPVAHGTLNATDVDSGAVLTWSMPESDTDYGAFAFNAATRTWTYTLDQNLAQELGEGQSATQTATIIVTDEFGATDSTTVTVTVFGSNDRPTAVAETISLSEDASLAGSVEGSDPDDNQVDALTYQLIGPAPTGLTFNSDGTYTFDASSYDSLAEGASQTITVQFVAIDQHGASSLPQAFTINLSGTNDAPVFGFAEDFSDGSNGLVTAGGYGAIQLVEEYQGATDVALLSPMENGGPYSRLGGYRGQFVDGLTSEVKVYLDTNWATGQGFEYSVATNNQVGNHLRDFVLSVSKNDSGALLVAGSNNSTGDGSIPDLGGVSATGTVAESGWYAIRHVFNDVGGALSVTISLLDESGAIVYETTLSAPSDAIADVVGGNRYAWFAGINVPGGLAVDGITLEAVPFGSVSELAEVDEAPGALLETSGRLVFDDVDTTDTHTVTVAPGSQIGSIAASIIQPATGSGGGVIDWQYTVDDADVSYLRAGASLVETFTIIVKDNFDATATQTVTITVVGTNDAPVVVTPIAAQSTDEDAAFSLNVSSNFDDVDLGDTLTYSATLQSGDPLPAWLSINPTTGVLSGTPENGDVGTISVTVTASDGEESASSTFDLTVDNTNDAPVVVTPIAAQNTDEDAAFSLDVSSNFDDVDLGDTLTYSATLQSGDPLPAWLSINPTTGVLSGTPENGDVGTISVTVTASDGEESASSTFDLTVDNTNDAPVVVTPIAAQNTDEDAAFSLDVSSNFDDVDLGDTLTYSATLQSGDPLPAWLSINPTTGVLSGTPENGDVGTISVTVTASDGEESASSTFDLTVDNTNDAPVVVTPIAAQSTDEDAAFSLDVSSNFDDVDLGDTLTYSATLQSGDPLPAWLSINPTTGVLSGTPENGDVGTISVTVTASDGEESASSTFDLTVDNTNDAPVVVTPIAAQSTDEDAAFSLDVSSNFDDVDLGDTLTYSATLQSGDPLPAWLSINPTTGVLSGTPENGDVGTISVTVTASDGEESASSTFDLTVDNTNDAPVVVTPIAAQNTDEDAAFSLDVSSNFDDVDLGDTLTYSATLQSGDPLPAWLSINPTTGVLSGTPENGDVGTISVTVTASDGEESASSTFDLTVDNTNDAPVVVTPIAAQNTDEDAAFSLDVSSNFDDVDLGDTLTYSATLQSGDPLPAWLSINPTTGVLSGTPENGDVGTISVTVTASDGEESASSTFDLTVDNTNDAPVVVTPIAAQSTDEDAAFSLDVSSNFDDVDLGDTLTYSATLQSGDPLPAWLSINPTTGVLSGTPENGDVGTISVTVTASDGEESASSTFDLTVDNTNDAPVVVTPIAAQSTDEDAAFSLNVSSNFDDVDLGDTLTYSATLQSGDPLPAWLSINPTTGVLSGTPENGDVGTISVTVTASDGEESASSTFDLTVDNTNDPANITVDSNVTDDRVVLEFNGVSGNNASGKLLVSDVDIGENQLSPDTHAGLYGSFTWAADGTWSYTLDNANGTVQALNEESTPLTDQVTVHSIDGTATHTITVTINGQREVINGTQFDDPAVNGTIYGDKIDAGTGDDVVNASNGDDWIYDYVGDGNDSYNGGSGTGDKVIYDGARGDYTVSKHQTLPIFYVCTRTVASFDTIQGVEIFSFNGVEYTQSTVISAPANVTVGDTNFTLTEDNPTTIALGNVFDHVTGPGPYSAAATSALSTNYGTFQLSSNGTVIYQLNNASSFTNALQAGQSYVDTLTFTVTGASGQPVEAHVQVTINGNNDAPSASNDTLQTIAENATNVSGHTVFAGLLSNDTDPEGNPLTIDRLLTVTNVDLSGFPTFLTTAELAQLNSRLSVHGNEVWFDDRAGLPGAAESIFDKLNPGETATVTFTYVIKDDQGAEATAKATFSVTGQYEVYNGTAGADTINGSAYADEIHAGNGADVIVQSAGADYIDGGDGSDTVDYRYGIGLVLDLSDGNPEGGAAAGDTFVNVERFWGSQLAADTMIGDNNANIFYGFAENDYLDGRGGNDLIYGGNGNDIIFGGEGNDVLFGEAGSDVIRGGAGDDVMWGGDSADYFIFDLKTVGADQIRDFQKGVDKIQFDLGAIGVSNASELNLQIQNYGDGVINAQFIVFDAGEGMQKIRVYNSTAFTLSVDDIQFI